MVIGTKGKCINSLQKEFGVEIRAMKADHQKNLPVPYFLFKGDERSVLFAALKVHSLLSLSMGRSEKELKAENEQLTKDNEELIGLLHAMDSSPEIVFSPEPSIVRPTAATTQATTQVVVAEAGIGAIMTDITP